MLIDPNPVLQQWRWHVQSSGDRVARETGRVNISISDGDIIRAYQAERPVDPDHPTELELCKIRTHLPIIPREALSLNWLRSQIVRLRKEGWLTPVIR